MSDASICESALFPSSKARTKRETDSPQSHVSSVRKQWVWRQTPLALLRQRLGWRRPQVFFADLYGDGMGAEYIRIGFPD